jgi:hypothetical protein
MKNRAEFIDTMTVALAMVGAVGAGMWAHNMGAGLLAFVVLLVGIARASRDAQRVRTYEFV